MKTKIFGILGIIGGLIAGLCLLVDIYNLDIYNLDIDNLDTNLAIAIGCLSFFIIAGWWIGIGIPRIWANIVGFCEAAGCLSVILFPLMLALVVFYIAPVDSFKEWKEHTLRKKLNKLKKNDDAKAQYNFGVYLMNRQHSLDIYDACDLFEKAATKGYKDAQLKLIECRKKIEDMIERGHEEAVRKEQKNLDVAPDTKKINSSDAPCCVNCLYVVMFPSSTTGKCYVREVLIEASDYCNRWKRQ